MLRPADGSAMSISPSLLALALVAAASCGSAPTTPAPDGRPIRPSGVPVFQGDFVPVDDTDLDASFAAVASDLRAILAARDTAALLALVAPEARLGFDDGPHGPDGLRDRWLRGDAAPALWDVLDGVLAHGFVGEEDAFTAPYVFALWPSDVDPFAHVAVPGRDVPAYDEPGGRVVARLSTIIVPVLAPRNGAVWQVRLPDGAVAFVDAADAVSPLGWRLSLWPEPGGAWKIQSLLSGD